MATAKSRKQEGVPDSLKKDHRGAPYGPGCPGLRYRYGATRASLPVGSLPSLARRSLKAILWKITALSGTMPN